MNILNEVYYKNFAENEKNVRFWDNYLKNLQSLDFSEFSNKLKVPALVPIGSRIFFRGELKHTNELTVALGADYFVKCSLKQAEVLRQHRIKDAKSKLDTFIKEKEHLDSQLNFKRNVFETEGQEVIEYHTEEEDKAWREKHRDNVSQYKQKKEKDDTPQDKITDEELWNRLEELELQEELENEFFEPHNLESKQEAFVAKDYIKHNSIDQSHNQESKQESLTVREDKVLKEKSNLAIKDNEECKEIIKSVTFETPTQTTKLHLLQQVIDRQNELESKFLELKNRERSQSKTEQDIISKLDEMEQLDELEDEMERLEDIIENEDVEEENDCNKLQPTKVQRRVSFVDDDDSETLELTFKHSSIDPINDLFDPEKGMTKPSDIYQAYSNLFGNGTTSILKKSKYEALSVESNKYKMAESKKVVHVDKDGDNEEIVIKDVIENAHQNVNKFESQARPTSLFKKRRMQSKS